MPSYWDRPGKRITSNSTNFDQPADLPPNSDMTDPFTADINPGTSHGQKLCIEACAPLEDTKKISASVENAHTIIRRITALAQKFR